MSTKTERTEGTERPGTNTRDPELAAMALMDRKLSALDEPARGRVLAWLLQKHGAQGKLTMPANDSGPALGVDGSHV